MRFCSRSSGVVVQVSACWLVRNYHVFGSELVMIQNTGGFMMFSVITNFYNKETKGPTIMELFTAKGKLKKFYWHLEMVDVCTTADTAHIDTIFKFLPHTGQYGCIDILHCYNDPCQRGHVKMAGRIPGLLLSFYLYRFRKYVSYGFLVLVFCNTGVHYETPGTGI